MPRPTPPTSPTDAQRRAACVPIRRVNGDLDTTRRARMLELSAARAVAASREDMRPAPSGELVRRFPVLGNQAPFYVLAYWLPPIKRGSYAYPAFVTYPQLTLQGIADYMRSRPELQYPALAYRGELIDLDTLAGL